MIVCAYTLKKRFVIRNKTLRLLNQNASSFYFGQTSYRAKQWKLTLTQLSFAEKYGTHRNRPYSVWNRGQYAANHNSRKHSPQYQLQWWLQNIIYNIQTRSLRWSNSTTGTFIYFLPERIHNFCPKEREVGFYADKLHITSRYLSSITQNVADKSAKYIIDKHAIQRIKIMLKYSNMSIQDISYELNFPDQSFFARYFKKHTGMTPLEYRAKP